MTGIIRFGRAAVGWRRTSTVDVPASGTPTPPPPPTVLAPSNSALPIITGATTKGQTLSCSTGSWLNLPTGFAYQWLRSGTAISGANGATYLLIAADVAANISCTVTASNTTGSTPATSATVGPVIDLAPVNTVLPALTGTPTVGQVLTVTTGTWNNSPLSFAYAWQLNGSPISGAASISTYTLTSGENGGNVTCIVTATNSGGSVSATSNALGPVGTAGTAPTINTIPTLSGDPVVGQTLFTTNGTWTGTVTSYTYQWFKDGTAVAFATNDNYLILDADAGSVFLCKVTAYNVGSPSTPAASAATSAVTNISLTNAITAFTRTSTSGTVPMTWSVTFGSNVYEGYYLRAQVYSDGTLTTQTQDVTHLLTNADLQSGATIDLTSDGLTTIGATSYLKLSVETNSPNQLYYSYAYPTPISPTDAVVTVTWSPTDKFAANSLTYSNGNLTVAGGSGLNSVRTTRAVGSDKTYWEVTVSSGSIYTIGVADTSADLTHPLGPTLDGLTSSTDAGTWFNGDNGQFGYNGARDATYHDIGEFHTTPGTVAIALDRVAKKLWVGTVSGGVITWFNGNPATPTGGLSMASIGTMYPFLQMVSATCTANFGTPGLTTGFAATPPTGFVAP